jgi:photosystem II stability/assembly factor-like uncharacterized protein
VLRIREPGAGLIAHRTRLWRRRLASRLAVVSIAVIWCAATFAAQTRRPSGRPAAPAASRHPQFKAIFEPVSYPRDVELNDVFFVDEETGWACGHHHTDAGEGGFIIGTRDGGKTWSVQLGDPNSPTRALARLFFFDATHGWATQAGGKMLRTTDGSTWTSVGDFGELRPFVFISPDKGFFLDGGQNIQATLDGGRTWKPAYHCRTTLGVTGLAHESECEPEAIAFATDDTTGYVVSRALDSNAAAVIKTTDGGATWTLASVIPETSGKDGSLVFVDPLTGYLRAAGALNMTSDGGLTWHRVAAPVPDGAPKILFAGSVGWMVGSNDFSYTLDNGKRWNARTIDFPARVVRFSLPAPDTGYVVGRHGMVYRYRVVPFDYTVPHMLAIPAMTAFTAGSP